MSAIKAVHGNVCRHFALFSGREIILPIPTASFLNAPSTDTQLAEAMLLLECR